MKTCSQCGTQNPDGARFCRACGTPFQEQAASASTPAAPAAPMTPTMPTPTAVQPTAPVPQMPTTPGYAPAGASGAAPAVAPAAKAPNKFGQWLLSALKTPGREADADPWFGFVVAGVTALLMALTVLSIVQKAVSALYNSSFGFVMSLMQSMSGSSYGSSYGSSAVSDFASSVFFKAFFMSALLVYALIGVVFLGALILGAGESFLTIHNRFARHLVIFDIAFLLTFLLALAGASAFAATMFFVFVLAMNFLVALDVARMRSTSTADGYWLLLAIIAILFIVLAVFMWLLTAVFVG